MYNENMYIKNVGLNIHKWKTTDDRSLLVLEYVRSICIMYRWTLFEKKFDMYKEILCTQKNVMGLTPWWRPIGLKAVSQGIMLLSIPMVSVYKQTNENKRKKFVYVWILTMMIWVCTNKICTKKDWDLHRKGGPWSIEKFERKRIRFYRINHGKKMQVWWKVLKNDFWKYFEM